MLRSILRKLSRTLTSTTRRPARPMNRRARLAVEGLEDRLVLSTVASAGLAGSTLDVIVDQQGHHITFTGDKHPGHVDVFLDKSTSLGQFPSASIKNVDVFLAGGDAVTVDDSIHYPFASGTTISLQGILGRRAVAGPVSSLTLTGTSTISGGETFTAGNGTQAPSLTLDKTLFEWSNAIAPVTDLVKTTAPLVVNAFVTSASLSGTNGVTQTLRGLSSDGAGDTLTFANKIGVELDMLSDKASATLNATAAAAGEHFFEVELSGNAEVLNVNATPRTGSISVVVPGQGSSVFLAGNSTLVDIAGNSTTNAILGTNHGSAGVTSGIKANVAVHNVGTLEIADAGNRTTQEKVTVTESTVSGTGLFGNSAAKVQYDVIGKLDILSGQESENYSVAASTSTAAFGNQIEIDGASHGGLLVNVGVDASSKLDLLVNNASTADNSATLIVTALGATFNPSQPPVSNNFAPTLKGSEVATFANGAHSIVVYNDFADVIAINHLPGSGGGGGSAGGGGGGMGGGLGGSGSGGSDNGPAPV